MEKEQLCDLIHDLKISRICYDEIKCANHIITLKDMNGDLHEIITKTDYETPNKEFQTLTSEIERLERILRSKY